MKFSKTHWNNLTEALRRYWPNLTDAELEATRGEFNALETLIQSKSTMDDTKIRETLAFIFDETQHGNPNSEDDFAGIERARSSKLPSASESATDEWNAREDSNEDRPDI